MTSRPDGAILMVARPSMAGAVGSRMPGFLVFQATSFDAEEASGFAVAEDRAPLIVVNRKDPPTRRSFSLLHELAHLMLHVSGVSDLHTDDARPPEDQAIEVFCNHVAAAALIPKGWLLNEARVVARGARATTWTDSEIADLARTFSVSREALVRRLLTFGRTTEAFYRQKRGQYLAEYLAQRQKQREETSGEGIPRNMPQETVSNFGGPLVRMILGNYYQDRLTLSDVAGYPESKPSTFQNLSRWPAFDDRQRQAILQHRQQRTDLWLALRAKDDETSPPRKFSLEGAEGSSRSCPWFTHPSPPPRVPRRTEAAGRRSSRHPRRRHPNYRLARVAGPSPRRTSCASSPMPIAPLKPAVSAPFCGGGDLLLCPHRLAAATRRRGLQCADSSQARPEDRCSEPVDCRSDPAPEGQCRADAAAGACRGHHRTPKKSCGVAGHPAGVERRRALTDAVVALAPTGRMTAAACAALGVSRATVQRRRARLTAALAIFRPRPKPARALTAPQQQVVLDLLHAPRFADQAPAEIYASLLDEGVYHCSIRTMYRLLGQNGEIQERRKQLRHPAYQKPECWPNVPTKSGPGTSPS